jgi:hypothetical protein
MGILPAIICSNWLTVLKQTLARGLVKSTAGFNQDCARRCDKPLWTRANFPRWLGPRDRVILIGVNEATTLPDIGIT